MLELSLMDDRTVYAPGELIRGAVTWAARPEPDDSLAIRLIWYTDGKGTRDYQTVDSIPVSLPLEGSRLDFEFRAPQRPLSFSGKLISLQWAIEVVTFPTRESQRCDFDLAIGTQKLHLADKSDQEKSLGVKKSWVKAGR